MADIPVVRVKNKLDSTLELLQSVSEEPFYTQLEGWKEIMVAIWEVLEDEEKLIGRRDVEIWVPEVRGLIYTVEDILDELDEAFRGKLTAKADQVSASKVLDLIPSCFSTIFNSSAVKVTAKIRSKIEETNNRLHLLARGKAHLGLVDGITRLHDHELRGPSTSFVDESNVFGMDRDRYAIIDLLLRDEASDRIFSVIPIVGMGGIGKTTLAQLAYGAEPVERHFYLRVWVCISYDFDVIRATKSILESVSPTNFDSDNFNWLQIQLRETLFQKRFLIVFDDVWIEDYNIWDILCVPLRAGAPGSKVIVTTRSEAVASIVGSLPPHKLQAMSYEDSLSLFVRCALGTANFDAHQDLKLVGEKMVKKCDGLPLTVKALGGCLRHNADLSAWVEISNCKISDILTDRTAVLSSLRPGYSFLEKNALHNFSTPYKATLAHIPVERVKNKLDSTLELLQSVSEEPFYTQLEGWKEIMVAIWEVLEDGEKLIGRRDVEIWVPEVRGLIYTVEDILDELDEAFRGKLTAKADQVSASKVLDLIPSCFSTIFNSSAVKVTAKIRSKIEETNNRLHLLARGKAHLGLVDGITRLHDHDPRLPSTSLVDESNVFGMDGDRYAIIDLLLRDEASDRIFSVIPIVGMGGIGKTTLAQLAYRAEPVVRHFDLRVWVCISYDFDVIRATKSILESVSPTNFDSDNFDRLQIQLRERLFRKRFLIVFDDVWIEDYNIWDILCVPLIAGAPGSKVIVTTRSEAVASIVGSLPPHKLQAMSYEDSLSLFIRCALGTANFDAHQDLKLVGEKMVKKCDGLPLTVKALAGCLRHNADLSAWVEISNREISDILTDRTAVLSSLRPGYSFLEKNALHNFSTPYKATVAHIPVERVKNKLDSTLVRLLAYRLEPFYTQLEGWKEILVAIWVVLEDEEKLIGRRDVEIWVPEARGLIYTVEDILDELDEAFRGKLTAKADQVSASKVLDLIPSCFSTIFNSSAVKVNAKIRSKIEETNNRLHLLARGKAHLGLVDGITLRLHDHDPRLPSTSLVDESNVFGMDGDRYAIIDLLLRDEASDRIFSVIPIVGMGGIGKTTLAQLAYGAEPVVCHFDLRVWVCISYDFDVIRATKSILESASPTNFYCENINSLKSQLGERLFRKRFLIVFDDVWIEDYNIWDILCVPLRAGAPGSKVIVTTRSEAVASIVGSLPPHKLQAMSYEDSLSLFTRCALGTANFDAHQDLKLVGEKLVKKCDGLPLAVKALAGCLRHNVDLRAWVEISNRKISDILTDRTAVLSSLRLSYSFLAPQLKQCFVYCSLFPKGYEFDKDHLVLLWMADGLLEQPRNNWQMEDFGSDCFDVLFSKSLLQQRSSSNRPRFVLHGLMCELVQSIAGESCLNLDADDFEDKYRSTSFLMARHMSFINHSDVVLKKIEALSIDIGHVRTFLALSMDGAPDSADCNLATEAEVPDGFLAKLKFSRALSFSGLKINMLPNLIGDLKFLRYLNLSFTLIKSLPETVSDLHNLQTLILIGCLYLTKLPSGMSNLSNLRHLDIRDTDQLQEMAPHMGSLRCLQTLPKFIVGKETKGLGIMELANLSQLRGKLSILALQNVGNTVDEARGPLEDNRIEELVMAWSSDFGGPREKRDEIHVLDFLKPRSNLAKLTIEFYGGKFFSNWMGDPSFSKMVHLTLSNCRRCTSLPQIGQLPFLKDLHITGMDGLKSVGTEFYGEIAPSVKPFPSLETLLLEDMPKWKHWSFPTPVVEVEAVFPLLRELTIRNCPRLIKLSSYLPPSLVNLRIFECSDLAIPLHKLSSLGELNLVQCRKAHLSTEGGADHTFLNRDYFQQIPRLSCWEEFKQFLETIQHLEIHDCTTLPDDFQSLVSLTDMRIEWSPGLVSFPRTVFPPMLRRLIIDCCENLKWLPDGLLTYGNSSSSCLLEHLQIRNCPSLISFPKGDIRNSLKQLEIEKCADLESLPEGMMLDDSISPCSTCHLQVLKLYRCPSLRSFPAGKFPSTLKRLEIWDCTQLEGISEEMLQNNTSLECLDFWNYPNLKTLPGCLTPYLKNLHIGNCVNFEFQSCLMQSLSSLQSLCIRRCPGLKSFQEGDLSPSLTSLQIEDCQNLKSPLSEWSLHRLTSLTGLRIGGLFPDVVSFSVEQGLPLLPTTVTHLSIDRIQNLESLVSLGFQNLTSLKELRFTECLKLHSFLPSEGLPSTVSMLFIRNCPLLGRRYSKNGEGWRDVAHIPCIRMYS